MKQTTNLGTAYDYGGVMHYGAYAFSKNGKRTIRVINGPQRSLGDYYGWSKEDILQVNRLYQCEHSK